MTQSAASFRQAVRVFAWTACVLASTVLAHPVQQSNGNGNGIIVGVVVDENHQPVPRARVQAFSAKDPRQTSAEVQGLIRPSGSASTDTAGTFRISGLADGDSLPSPHALPTFPHPAHLPAPL